MNRELEKQISGDWFDLREAQNDPVGSASILNLDSDILLHTAGELRQAVEGGIIEYKERTLRQIFSTIESLQYDSRAFSRLEEEEIRCATMIWCCLQQRRRARGSLSPAETKNTTEDETEASPEVMEKPSELLNRAIELIQRQPEVKQSSEGKIIILQIKQYRQETKKLNELLAKIPEEKREAVRRNSAQRLKEILEKLSVNVKKIEHPLSSEHEERDERQGDPAAREALAEELLSEAKELSSLRSAIIYSRKDRFQSRRILLDLQSKKETLGQQIQREQQLFSALNPFEPGSYSLESAKILRSEAEKIAEELA